MAEARAETQIVGGNMTALRIDDIGASSKRWERHRGKWFPYPELGVSDLVDLGEWLRDHASQCTLAITACWVESSSALTPYPRKFPNEARAIKTLVEHGFVEIACHGLTHCVPGRHVPSWIPWRGNRQWHREFIDAIPFKTQVSHLEQARRILEHYFGTPVTTLVPPGNAISERLALTALDLGFDLVTCRSPWWKEGVTDDSKQVVIHDREFMWRGVTRRLDRLSPTQRYTTVRASVPQKSPMLDVP